MTANYVERQTVENQKCKCYKYFHLRLPLKETENNYELLKIFVHSSYPIGSTTKKFHRLLFIIIISRFEITAQLSCYNFPRLFQIVKFPNEYMIF